MRTEEGQWIQPTTSIDLFVDGPEAYRVDKRGNFWGFILKHLLSKKFWLTVFILGTSGMVGLTLYLVNAVQIAASNKLPNSDLNSISQISGYIWTLIYEVMSNFSGPIYQPQFLLGVATAILTLSILSLLTFELNKLASSVPGAFRRLMTIYLVMLCLVLIFGHIATILYDVGEEKKLTFAIDVAVAASYLMIPIAILIQFVSDAYVAKVYRQVAHLHKKSAKYFFWVAIASLILAFIGICSPYLAWNEAQAQIDINSNLLFIIDLIIAGAEAAFIMVAGFIKEDWENR